MLGIDTSQWQRALDWTVVPGSCPVDQYGVQQLNFPVEYAYIKATHGAKGIDPQFIRSAKYTAGVLRRGFYAWFVPAQDPIEQADHFVDSTDPFALKNDLPPQVDFEQDDPAWRGLKLRERLRAMMERIEDRRGKRCVLYTGKWYWDLACGSKEDDSWLAGRALSHSEYRGHFPREGEHANLPYPWMFRDIPETFWQFDGDKGLYLPGACSDNGRPIDVDFLRFGNEQLSAAQALAALDLLCEGTLTSAWQLETWWQPQTEPETVLPNLIPPVPPSDE